MCKNGPSECRVTCMPHHALAHEQSVLHACCMHSCPNILCTCENTNCTAHYGIAPLKTNFTSTSSTHAYAHPCTQNAYAHCTHMGTISKHTLYCRLFRFFFLHATANCQGTVPDVSVNADVVHDALLGSWLEADHCL